MKFRQILTASAAVILMAGCADYGMGYSYGEGPRADIEYDGYYDGAYGQIYDGYWNNNVFYYRNNERDHWRRGDERHFRRDEASGYNHIHGMAHHRDREGHDHQ